MKNIYFILFLIIQMLFNIATIAQVNEQYVFLGNSIGETSMSFNNITNVFKAKKTSWKNNNPIIIVLPSGKTPNASGVSKYIYNTTFTAVQKFWLSEVFQGRSKPPVFFDSDEEIIQFINKNEGSIGIISNNKALNIPAELIIKIEN
jgi:hypothetical protein